MPVLKVVDQGPVVASGEENSDACEDRLAGLSTTPLTPTRPRNLKPSSRSRLPMDNRTISSSLAVFSRESPETASIDNIKISLWPSHPALIRRPPGLSLSGRTLVAGVLSAKVADLVWIDGKQALQWTEETWSVRQFLGSADRSKRGSVSFQIDWNPLRAIRRDLEREGRIGPALGKDDNYLPDGILPKDEVQRRIVQALATLITQQIEAGRWRLYWLFGIEPGTVRVEASVNVIEVAWDQPCRIAGFAARGYESSWSAEFSRDSIPSLHEHRWLKGASRKGEEWKMYEKAPRLLRIEAQLNKTRIRKLLGHRVRLTVARHLTEDLQAIAGHLLERINRLEAGLEHPGPIVHIPDFFASFVPKGQRDAVRRIVEALLVSGKVHRDASKKSEWTVLNKLRKDGRVRRSATRGWWMATPGLRRGIGDLHIASKAIESNRNRRRAPRGGR